LKRIEKWIGHGGSTHRLHQRKMKMTMHKEIVLGGKDEEPPSTNVRKMVV